jgi:hypothetical protein
MAVKDSEFLEAMLHRHAEDPSMFFMKGMEALMKIEEELCTMSLRVALKSSRRCGLC